MKRCHDCGNPHLERGGWCMHCQLYRLIPRTNQPPPILIPDDIISVQPITEEENDEKEDE